MSDVVSSILFGTIWGAALFAGFAYVVVLSLGKVMRKELPATAVAVLVGIVCVVVFPSLPRFKFEDETRTRLSAIPGVRIINETRWGDLVEPVTWFAAPVGSFTAASPDPLQEGTFQTATFRYGEIEPLVSILDVDCETRSHFTSVPDESGVFRILPDATELTDKEYTAFCESSWDAQRQEIRNAIMNKDES